LGSFRNDLESAEWGEPRFRQILLHDSRAFFVPGVDDHYPLESVLCHKPGDLLPGALEDRIVGVHPVQIVIEECDLEVILAQGLKCGLSVLGKERIG
jgi:hypothetical protein